MKRIAVFIACLLFGLTLIWLGGYDFDERGVWVAWGAFTVVACSALIAACPGLE